MNRSVLLALATSWLLACGVAPAQTSAPVPAPKTIRYAFPVAETNFDPAQISDIYSRAVIAGILEAPLEFAFLSPPGTMRPNTAAAMPEVSADFKTFTFRIKPGIFFADDPAFGGRPRELVAADYVYALERHYDPRWKSGSLYILEGAGILGLSELRQKCLAERKPFDYDAPVEGLKTLDRYTFQVRLSKPSPRFLYNFADPSFTGAVAREVVEAYGDHVGDHPVGTGPFRLAQWQRGSRIVLARSPSYRDVRYDEQPPPGNTRLQAIAAQLKGRRLPLVDRVQIAIIEEPQPRWLAFLNDEQDIAVEVPADFASVAFPNNKLAPNLARRGIGMVRYAGSTVSLSYFAMNNPMVGGYTPAKVALRRAIALAVDVDREIRFVRGGQAIPAQSIIAPGAWGYDPAFKSEMSDFDLPRAKALLDLYGYVDRDGDGWRDQPDGSPLRLEYATSPDQVSRALTEQWQKNMDALGVRIVFKVARWPEQLKASRAGKLMMWGVGWSAAQPDGDTFLALGYGPNRGQANLADFDLPAFNKLYEQQSQMPDGPERQAVMDAAKKLLIVYMPYKVHVHRIWTDLTQPWVVGYHRNIFVREFWKYVDIDPAVLLRRHPH